MKLEEKVHHHFIAHQWTLSFAESCTGGLLSTRLVAIPDCSLYFLGSIVSYSNEAKKNLLNVSQETLNTFGAVSEQCAKEMVLGAVASFHSDVSLSVTGFAGPGNGEEFHPVGTVSFALVRKGENPISWTERFSGERKKILESATKEAFRALLKLS